MANIAREDDHILGARASDVSPEGVGVLVAHNAGLAAPDEFEFLVNLGEAELDGAGDDTGADVGVKGRCGPEGVGEVVNPSARAGAVPTNGYAVGGQAKVVGDKDDVGHPDCPADFLGGGFQFGHAKEQFRAGHGFVCPDDVLAVGRYESVGPSQVGGGKGDAEE